MAYTKPVIAAQNSKQGTFAAGCPEKTGGGFSGCDSSCEIRK